jgi:hypothetical protein
MVDAFMVIPWRLEFEKKRARNPRRGSATKFPGVQKFMDLLREYSIERIAEELTVTPHTVQKWVKMHELSHLLPTQPNFHATHHNRLAYQWARVKLSKAQGINGWFRKLR